MVSKHPPFGVAKTLLSRGLAFCESVAALMSSNLFSAEEFTLLTLSSTAHQRFSSS
jgi:hypothetical protein